jgi:hypothetical protein
MRGLLLALVIVSVACGEGSQTSTPAGALRQFLTVMDESASDEDALRSAYGLLSKSARTRLDERAMRARTLAGQDFEPWRMLAQGRFRLRFAPARSRGMRERIEGDRAVVLVVGEQAGDQAEVPLVREDGHWRIDLAIPAMRADASAASPSAVPASSLP